MRKNTNQEIKGNNFRTLQLPQLVEKFILLGNCNPMMLHIKRWLAPPVFPDDEIKTRRANLLNSALINILTLAPMLFIGDLLGGKSHLPSFAAEVLAFAFCLVLRSWMHRGRVRLASIGLITMGLVLITAVVASKGTIRVPTTAMYLLVVITAGLLFDLRGMMITTALCSLLIGGLIGAENAGLLPRPDYSVTMTQWVAYTVIFAWTGSLTFSSLQAMLQALTRADKEITERKQAEESLHKAHDELELRVQKRTADLKEANKALLESEASYRELTESIDDLFYAMNRDLRYTYWNKASEALTGISAKDAIGKSLLELFPDIKGTKAEQFYLEALKTQQPKRFEYEYQLGDNKKLIFEINAYPSKGGLSVIAKDITEKKLFDAHLLRAQRMESIGTLAGGIAHDLNNMLTPIMLSLQLLKERFKDEQSQKSLTILEQNSQRGADLIKQVLSFSRGVEGERAPLAAKHIITEIEKVAKETFPRNIEIRTDIKKDLFTISGDATQLHQVIMNLCVNARDAMPDGGILNITASNFFVDENYARMHTEAKVGSYVAISVSDTGIGIPPHILDRIFEPFFTTKEFGKGTGLGLSTALAIVKSHGGFINVESEVGKGTTFRVYLSAIKTKMQNVEEEQLELLVGHGELVLVAEDEDSIREVTASTLEKYGYNVLAANDGADAVALYIQNVEETKVILMDLMMPVMDGEASIREIHKINPEVKIIAVSGLAEKDRLKDVADYTNAFLPKPYTAKRLLKTIHDVLSAE